MKLSTINNALRFLGVVLVVEVWDGEGEKAPTRFYFRQAGTV